MAGSGGARSGAGRKPKSEKFAPQIDRAERKIADRLPSLIDNMFALAEGVSVEEPGEDGEPRIFKKAPDRAANEYLINRILGKPVERHEHDIDAEIALVMAEIAAARQEEASR